MPYDRISAKRLITTSVLQKLQEPRPWPWLRDVAFDWALIVAAMAAACLTLHPLVILLSLFVLGNRQHALALLGHDGTHYTITKRKRLNDALTDYLTWIPLGLTNDGYRTLHHQHHTHLGTEQDPEVQYKGVRGEHWDLPTTPGQVIARCLLDLVGGGFKDYHIIFSLSMPDNADLARTAARRRKAVHAAFVALSGAAALLNPAFLLLPALWYGALVTTFIMFFRLRLWLEHQGTDTAHRLRLKVWQAGLLAPHLCWHHWEHHMWPTVPYSNLPAIRKLLPDEPLISLMDLVRFYRDSPGHPAGHPTAMARI